MSFTRVDGRPPRLLVTGGSGFIGRHLLARLPPGWQWAATYFRHPPAAADERWHHLDLRDEAAVAACLRATRPEVIVHLAYDKADPGVTASGTARLQRAAEAIPAHLLLLSTDQVFDGQRGDYREGDGPSPINAYGQAKVLAEEAVRGGGGLVVRTSLVYRVRPPDPVNRELLVAPLARGETPRLFVDEWRCPIHVDDLAAALIELCDWPVSAWEDTPRGGTLHVAGPEPLDRYTFACRLAPFLGIDATRLHAARLAESGLARPANCTLDTSLARQRLRTRLRTLDEVLGAESTADPATPHR